MKFAFKSGFLASAVDKAARDLKIAKTQSNKELRIRVELIEAELKKAYADADAYSDKYGRIQDLSDVLLNSGCRLPYPERDEIAQAVVLELGLGAAMEALLTRANELLAKRSVTTEA